MTSRINAGEEGVSISETFDCSKFSHTVFKNWCKKHTQRMPILRVKRFFFRFHLSSFAEPVPTVASHSSSPMPGVDLTCSSALVAPCTSRSDVFRDASQLTTVVKTELPSSSGSWKPVSSDLSQQEGISNPRTAVGWFVKCVLDGLCMKIKRPTIPEILQTNNK